MRTVCRVELIGRLGADPEIRTMQDGNRSALLSIATEQRWKDRSGDAKTKTHWHTVIILQRHFVDLADRYCRKGMLVRITGALENRKYTGADGRERMVTEIVIRPYRGELIMLEKPQRSEYDQSPEYQGDDHA